MLRLYMRLLAAVDGTDMVLMVREANAFCRQVAEEMTWCSHMWSCTTVICGEIATTSKKYEGTKVAFFLIASNFLTVEILPLL